MHKFDFTRKLVLSVTGVLALIAPIVFGQATATQSPAEPQTDITTAKVPEFLAVTIKPDKISIHGTKVQRYDGTTYSGFTLQEFLEGTYGVTDNQIIGAPSWVKSERYTLETKVDPSVADYLHKLSSDDAGVMNGRMRQALLADRFQLKVHHDTKELPVYVMVIAKNGLKLQEPKPGETLPEGFVGRRGTIVWAPGHFTGRMIPFQRMVQRLSFEVHRPIIDKTGLTGIYDFDLQWDLNEGEAAVGGQPGNVSSPPEISGVSFFAAIQEQLGLKLTAQKGPVDVLVIDHVEKPSPN